MERMSVVGRPPVTLLAAMALGSASCASLLGVEGDYRDRGAGGEDATSSTSGATTTATSSTGEGATSASSAGGSGPGQGGAAAGGGDQGGGDQGGGGDGGSASSAGGGGSGSGGGAVDCDVLQCADVVAADVVPGIATRPRLRRRTADEVWLTLLANGEAWRGLVGPATVLGETLGVNAVDAQAYPEGEVAYLTVAEVLQVGAPDGQQQLQSPLLGGTFYGPPLFVARQFQGDGETMEVDRYYAVTVDDARSAVFTCPEVPVEGPCVETWSPCAAVPTHPPTHALVGEATLFAAARACGSQRTLLVESSGTPVPDFPQISDVLEVDLAPSATPPLVTLAVVDEGNGLRSVRIDNGNGEGFDFGVRPAARHPTVTATLQNGVWGAWVETVGGIAVLQSFRCEDDLSECVVKRLHVEGGLAEGLARPQIVVAGRVLYAWERGSTVVLAEHPSSPLDG